MLLKKYKRYNRTYFLHTVRAMAEGAGHKDLKFTKESYNGSEYYCAECDRCGKIILAAPEGKKLLGTSRIWVDVPECYDRAGVERVREGKGSK